MKTFVSLESRLEIAVRGIPICNSNVFVSFSGQEMNAPPPVYASSCPALQSNLSLHSSSYYSEYSGAARRRLSSTGEADTSATSSYEGSDSSENSDESRLEPVNQIEREQLETFFRGLKSQVKLFRIFFSFFFLSPSMKFFFVSLEHNRCSFASRWPTCIWGTRRRPKDGSFDLPGFQLWYWTLEKRDQDPRDGSRFFWPSVAHVLRFGGRRSTTYRRTR